MSLLLWARQQNCHRLLRILQGERLDKLRLVAAYNLRLDERKARKAFLQAQDLLNLRRYQARRLRMCRLSLYWRASACAAVQGYLSSPAQPLLAA